MTIKLIGTCYSGNEKQRCYRTVIGFEDEWRLSRRKFEQEKEAIIYGRRIFVRLERRGRWERVKEAQMDTFFDFTLMVSGISREQAEHLLAVFIELAEMAGGQVGGGFVEREGDDDAE